MSQRLEFGAWAGCERASTLRTPRRGVPTFSPGYFCHRWRFKRGVRGRTDNKTVSRRGKTKLHDPFLPEPASANNPANSFFASAKRSAFSIRATAVAAITRPA